MNAACSVIESLIPHRELPVQPRPPRPINAASPPLASSEQSNAAMIRSLMTNLSPEKQAVLELRLQQKLTRSTGNDSASKVPQRDGKSESANLDRGAVSRLTALREQSIPRWNMIHAGRCGSTLLGLLLDNHPKITWDGELFVGHWDEFEKRARERGENTSTRWNSSKYYPNDPIRYIQSCAEVFPSRQYGFSIKFFHLEFLNLGIEDYLQRVAELGFVHNVVLERKNLLRVVVSALVAEAKGVYHLQQGQKSELRPIHLDVNNVEMDSQARPLLDFLETYEQQYRALATASGAHHKLWLVYEEDIEKDPLRAYRRCCEFLEVDPHPVSIPTARTTPFPLSEVLMNFDEVAASLKGTRFEWMLSD